MLLSNKGVVKQIKVNGLYYGINGECYMSDELGWSTSDYVPAHGEIVIYRESSAPFNTRFKIGDGSTVVGNLDFVEFGSNVDLTGYLKSNNLTLSDAGETAVFLNMDNIKLMTPTTIFLDANSLSVGLRNHSFSNNIIMGQCPLATTTLSSMSCLSVENYDMGKNSINIGVGIFNGFKGFRINTLNAVKNESTFTVTLKDAFPTDSSNNMIMPSTNDVWIFCKGAGGIYGKFVSRSSSSTAPSANPYVYTIKAVNYDGTNMNNSIDITLDRSSNNDYYLWYAAIPYSTYWKQSGGVNLTMGNSTTLSDPSPATHPINNVSLARQTFGLGNINMGNNIVNYGSRSIVIGNDLGITFSSDKVILIGNGSGNSNSYMGYAYQSDVLDGDTNAMNSRRVEIVNKFTHQGNTTNYSASNSSIAMSYQGISYISMGHTFSCNTVNSTSNKIALNAPLTLSSSYTYGSSLPTTYLQAGRIFFLV